MSRTITIGITVTIDDEADPDEIAESIFNFFASDPDDLFPQILTVDDYKAQTED